MQNKRKDISYIEDIIEEAFGECNEKELEFAKSLFTYIIEELKIDTDSLGYRFPHLGVLYLDYYLYKAKQYDAETEEEKLLFINRLGTINMYSDELGGKSKNKMSPYLFKMESNLRKKFNLPKERLNNVGRIPPVFLAAVERLQNNNFEKTKKENE